VPKFGGNRRRRSDSVVSDAVAKRSIDKPNPLPSLRRRPDRARCHAARKILTIFVTDPVVSSPGVLPVVHRPGIVATRAATPRIAYEIGNASGSGASNKPPLPRGGACLICRSASGSLRPVRRTLAPPHARALVARRRSIAIGAVLPAPYLLAKHIWRFPPMIEKHLLAADRVRRPPTEGFSWIDRRFLRHFASRLTGDAIFLYFFLAAVSDQQGVSFYGDTTIAVRLRMREEDVVAARDELVIHDLVAYQAPLTQVLSLPTPSVQRGYAAAIRELMRGTAEDDLSSGTGSTS
jgi:hypothetical protein